MHLGRFLHFSQKVVGVTLKDVTIPRSGHSDVVLSIHRNTFQLNLITLLSIFSEFFSFLGITGRK